jgi:tetratricopeptide (TPR) repeat protein
MIDIEKLEKRWFRYRVKQLLPYIALLTATLLIVGGIALFFNNPSKSKMVSKEKEVVVEKKSIQPKVTSENNRSKVEQKKPIKHESKERTQTEEKQILSPSLNFINNIKKSKKKHSKSRDKRVKSKILESKIEEIHPNSNIIIIDKQSKKNDIKDVIKRFETDHNPALSLFISKKYYELGDYESAYNYALKTNEINSNIEESWILFAKSLFKLNKKEQSIALLKRYISHTNSTKATQLLNSINQGEFH